MKKRNKIPVGKLQAKSYKLKAGFSLVEVVIGVSLILLSLTGLISAYSFYLKAGLRTGDDLKAAFLLTEGVESVRLLRDDAWSNLASLPTGVPYYLAWGGTGWIATTTATTTEGFTRTFVLDDVYRRNSDKDIVASTSPDAKSLDPNTKKLTVRIVSPNTATTTVETYLANLFE